MEKSQWFAVTGLEAAEQLQVDLNQGLTKEEVDKRLERYGPNALKEEPPRSILAMFIDQLKETLIIILIIAAIVSGALGEWIDSIVIMIIVVLNAILGVFQENKAEQALKALKEMTKAHVKVLREGHVTQINVEDLVPGDVVLLEAGDSVPADGRLVEVASLMVNEAALTGESVPVEKNIEPILQKEVPIADQSNMVFMGTYITGGRAKAVITGTGTETELGKIAEMLHAAPPDPTPLQKQLASLGKTLGIAAGIIVAVVFLTGIWRGEEVLGMFMTAVALAVAAIPEGLPTVVTIVLALGVTRMSKRNAVIRRMPAVETLGVASFICSDKTGTLTKNEMTVTDIYLPGRDFKVTGTGYEPEGEFLAAEDEKISPVDYPDLELMLKGAALNTDARLEHQEKGYQVIGDPTEGALVVAARKGGIAKEAIEKQHPRLGEIPFDSGRKMMTTFHQLPGNIFSFTKGAPDVLLARCQYIHREGSSQAMSEEEREELLAVNSRFASKGQRVLALAYRVWPELPKELKSETVERDLVFLGYFVMIDPPRPEAKEAVAVSHTAGIRTVMITGDHRDTALAIAKELGIWQEGNDSLTGLELARLSDEELRQKVMATTVYARVSPEDKLRIVDALKANEQVVAMTGDGVNDAPALKRADIGAAMGITGTEVSKEAADMVLLDDNFATIVNAVEEGRTIYSNIRKSIYYLLSCNVGEIIAIFGAILLGLGSPLTPIQILWMNLVTDGLPALALGVEPPEKDIMNRPPRDSREGVFAGGMGFNILFQGAIIGLLTLSAYWLTLSWGRSQVEAQTIAFLTIALSQLVHSFNARSLEHSIFTLGFNTNRYLVFAFSTSLLLQLAVVLLPFLQGIFDTTLLQSQDWALVIGFSLVPLVVVEVGKLIKGIAVRVSPQQS
ncbi:MAG: calcium-translocating P-type ATPase, SERCA-type [Clostridia bacterium]|jgi:Ca2+-transporting ATPase|nr:calcium-translocating P-type ATPase, SERCA-type [Clostridia bacterium]